MSKETAPSEQQLLEQAQDRSTMEKMLTEALEPPPQDELTNEQDDTSKAETGQQGNEEGTPDGEGEQEEKPEAEEAEEAEETERSLKQGKLHQEEKDKEGKDKEPEHKEEEELDDFEKEIESFQLRKGASEKSVNALQALKKKARAEHKARIEFEKKNSELEETVKSAKPMAPEVEKELEDLRNFRKFIDIENDPEFNKQHTEAVTKSQDHIMGLLKSWNLPDSMQKFIQDNGGPFDFSTSEHLMPANFKNEDGSPMTQSQWWENNIGAKLFPKQKIALDYAMRDYYGKVQAKEQAIRDARANRENIIKERTEKAQTAQKEYGERMQAHIPKVLKELGIEDIQLKEVPKNATPAEKAAIEKHNAQFKASQELAARYAQANTPEDRVEAALWATYGQMVAKGERGDLMRQIEDLKGQNKKLQATIDGIKKSSKTLPKDATPPSGEKRKVEPSVTENAGDRMAKMMAARES